MKRKTRRDNAMKNLLKNPWWILSIGGAILLVCIGFKVLLAKNSTVSMAIAKEKAETTSRPVTAESGDGGNSAAAGDDSIPMAGDGNTAIKVSAVSNGQVSVHAEIHKDCVAIQCGTALLLSAKDLSGLPIGAFARCKQLNGSTAFKEAIGVSTASLTISIDMMADLLKSTMQTKEAMDRRDRHETLVRAERTRNEACRLMDFNVPFSDEAKKALADAAEGPCESAWFRHDYTDMKAFATRIVDACGFPPPIRAFAYKRLVELLESECEFYEPSLDELMVLRKYGREYAYEYLNLFARWGYLRPRFQAGDLSSDYYMDFFGFDEGLEYRQTVCLRRNDGRGGELVSNEIGVQSLGLWSYRYLDLTDAYAKCCGRRTDPAAKLAVEFDTGMKFDEEEIAGALAKISLKAEPVVDVYELPEQDCMVAQNGGYRNNAVYNLKLRSAAMPDFIYNEMIVNGVNLDSRDSHTVPEPTSAILVLLGAAGLLLRRQTSAKPT